MKVVVLFAMIAVLVLALPLTLAEVVHITLMLDKSAYGPGEGIEVYGRLMNSSGTMNNTNVTLTVGSSAYILTTDYNGTFYSRSDYYTGGTLVQAPNTPGSYNVTASYGSTNTSVSISVVSRAVDNIILDLDKGSYYAGQAISVRAYARSGDIGVANFSVNGSMKTSLDAAVSGSTFSCITDSGGSCTFSLTAPSTSGQYYIQTSDYMGYSVFFVNPFDVSIVLKDSTATTNTYVFKRGDSGYVNVVVTYNSTAPTGTYTATGSMVNENGSAVYSLGSATLSQSDSYSSNIAFTVDSSFATGSYRALVNVSKSGGETVSKYSSYFEVRDWTLSVEKTSTNSGFEYEYTAFSNRTVFFEALPVDKSTSNTIRGLENSFNISLKNNFGVAVASASALAYDSQCSCYKFNLTTPSSAGTYTLSVSAYYNETQTVERIITVTNVTVSATTTDVAGSTRTAYTSEYIYIKPTLANISNSSFEPDDAEIGSVTYENGSAYSYTNVSNWSAVNLSNSAYEWSWNSTSKMLKMDAPELGGLFMVEVYANNRSARTIVKFFKKPYMLRVSFKNSEDTSVTNDYWWQFKTSDTIYAHIVIVSTDVSSIEIVSPNMDVKCSHEPTMQHIAAA